MNVTGKVCVLTGASSGIGRRTSVELARAGAIVCAAARRRPRLAELVDELGGEPHSYVVADVSSRTDAARLAAHVRDTYGRCDVLINNAGFSRREAFGDPDGLDALERVMATNFFGAVWCTWELLSLLKASAPAGVVNVSSIAGRLASTSSSYGASKFALVGWSESLHYELAPFGISVTSVEPGLIPTEGFPQRAFVESRWLRAALGSDGDVAAAILDVIRRPKLQRTVPRWYYLLQIPRLLTPPLYRYLQARLIGRRR